MILGSVIFAVGLALAALAYWAGRADGWQQAEHEINRAHREETQRLNLRRNAELIHKSIRRDQA